MATKSKVAAWLLGVGLVIGLELLAAPAADAQKKDQGVWTDPEDKSLPEDFKLQGEYSGEIKGGGKIGAQVIALGKDVFQAVLCPGGLPGDGWDGKQKILMDGKHEGGKTTFIPTAGKRKYLAQKPAEFSATSVFPPLGQKDCTATIVDGILSGKGSDGKTFELKKTIRKSPTLGQKPGPGALVLFDGTTTEEVKGGRLDKQHGILNTDGADIFTTRKFADYTVHAEFMLPFKPAARGQGRGNSGLYMVDHYEVQVLDSFGLDGKDNECGGIYTLKAPNTNMCLPPLQWQTYDIDFTNAVVDSQGKKVKNARITARHNGTLIHDNVEIARPTGGGGNRPEGTPGPLRLQGHGNPLQYRNIWIVEKK